MEKNKEIILNEIMGNFYETSEELDDFNLSFFNRKIGWFKEMHRQDLYSRIDWFCVDKKGRNCSVELKTRFNDIFKYETIFLEPGKYDAMIEKYNEEGYIPLYINFMQDNKHVAVFDLRKFNRNNVEILDTLIFNPGPKEIQMVKRLLLPVREASYYEYDTTNKKYIKRW